MADRERARCQVDLLLDALERERVADSDEERGAAQRAALEVTNDFLEEIGVLNLLRRRMAAFVFGSMKALRF
jgi:hypothetical protein